MREQLALIRRYGSDILASPGMRAERAFIQHGEVSVFRHSLGVAVMCLRIARGLRLRVDERALVRGALLHDYFLYDWHVPDPAHRWHGFTHPRAALRNAARDFTLSCVERDMIASHMFPMTLPMPGCRESVILCVADKLCATGEIVRDRRARLFRRAKGKNNGERG